MKLLPVILAGNANKLHNFLYVVFPRKYQSLSVTSTGNFIVVYYKDGEKVQEAYPAGITSVSVDYDVDTVVMLSGDVVLNPLNVGSYNMSKAGARSSLQTTFGSETGSGIVLKEVDFQNCENIREIRLGSQDALEVIRLNKKNDLQRLELLECPVVGRVDLEYAQGLTNLRLKECINLVLPDFNKFPNIEVLALENMTIQTTLPFDLWQNLQRVTLDGSIIGSVSLVNKQSITKLSANNTTLQEVVIKNAPLLTEVMLTPALQLTRLDISECDAITKVGVTQSLVEVLDFSSLVGLKTLFLNGHGNKTLDLSGCTQITSISAQGPTSNSLSVIKCRALDSTFASNIADYITNSDVADGVVYLNDQDAYYSTVADAATAKGWTIEPLA